MSDRPRENNFYFLFAALMLLVFLTPVITDLDLVSPPLLRAISYSTVLAIGVWSLQGSRRIFLVGMFLAGAGVLVALGASTFHSAALGLISMIIFIAFLLVAIAESLRKVLFSDVLSVNRLIGAVCVYLMLGLLWGNAYALLFVISPEAFRFPDAVDAFSIAHWNYYSFVTLTTLGYGEIVPLSATARTLAYAEAVFGQLYIAILVAGLVGAYISKRHSGDVD